MNKVLSGLIICSFSLTLWAAPKLNEISSEAQLTPFFRQLADRDKKTDDVFYTIEDDYSSTLHREEIDYMLDPANNFLPNLFSDPFSLRRVGQNLYDVQTSVNAVVDTLDIENRLQYSIDKKGNSTVHNYHFRDFNMLFSESKIQVVVKNERNGSEISIRQVSGMKGDAHNKLKKIPFGTATMKKKMLNNIKRFKEGTSGH